MNHSEPTIYEMQQQLRLLQQENTALKQQLKSQETSSFRQLCADYSQECLVLFNNNKCENANNAFLQQLNFTKDQLNTLACDELFNDKSIQKKLKKIIAERKNSQFQTHLQGNNITRLCYINIFFPPDTDNCRFILTATDISACKEKKLRIKIEHDELDAIFNTSIIGIIYFDMNRTVKRANKRAAEIFGYSTPSALIGMDRVKFHFNQENMDEFNTYYQTVLLKGETLTLPEFPLKKLGGEIIWVELSGKAIKTPDNPNQYSGILWTFDDITERRKNLKAIQNNNRELNAYFENSMVGIMVITPQKDGDRIMTRINRRFLEIVGYDSKEELLGKSVEMFHLTKKNHDDFGVNFVQKLKEGGINYFEYQFKKKDGTPRWAAGSAQAIDTNIPADLSKGVIFMYDDTTERKEDLNELKKANAELTTYFNNSMVGIIISDKNNTINRINKKMANILGYENSAGLLHKNFDEFYYNTSERVQINQYFTTSLLRHTAFNYELQLKGKDGNLIWVLASGQTIDQSSEPDLNKGVVWVIEDITARKTAEEKLVKLACIDELTQINNRRNFISLCEKEYLKSKRKGYQLAILMIDLDHFKNINDSYGHAAGDLTLKYFADICQKVLRPADIFGRIGGEEFAVLLTDINIEQAVIIAERLRGIVATSATEAPEGVPPITVSIGISIIKENDILEEAIKRADRALYKAKDSGRNRAFTEL